MTRASRSILAIDYGTTYTCAALALDGGEPEVLEIEGQRRFPSMVVVDGDGRLRTGRTARNSLKRDPTRGERTPKRHLSRVERLPLGPEGVPVVEAVAAVLARVAREARYRNNRSDPDRVVLTHPVRWEEGRRQLLLEAAERAGLPAPELVAEPVAAALHFVARRGVEPGARVAVYDLGGGTYDTAVLQATAGGFELAGMPGGDPEIGGERFDDWLLRLVGERIAELDADLWARLINPEGDNRSLVEALELRDAVREAKELLSDETSAEVHVRALDRSIRVTRSEFEGLIRGVVGDTVDELVATVAAAGIQPGELAAVYLTGDSSRIPAIFTAVHQRLRPLEPTVWDDPKAVVAIGAARWPTGDGASETGTTRIRRAGGPATRTAPGNKTAAQKAAAPKSAAAKTTAAQSTAAKSTAAKKTAAKKTVAGKRGAPPTSGWPRVTAGGASAGRGNPRPTPSGARERPLFSPGARRTTDEPPQRDASGTRPGTAPRPPGIARQPPPPPPPRPPTATWGSAGWSPPAGSPPQPPERMPAGAPTRSGVNGVVVRVAVAVVVLAGLAVGGVLLLGGGGGDEPEPFPPETTIAEPEPTTDEIPPPSATITGPAVVEAGTTERFFSNPSDATGGIWTDAFGAQSPDSAGFIDLYFPEPGSYTFSITVVNEEGVTRTFSKTVEAV